MGALDRWQKSALGIALGKTASGRVGCRTHLATLTGGGRRRRAFCYAGLVKLRQFDPETRTLIRAHIDRIGQIGDLPRPGVGVTPFCQDNQETVRIEAWNARTEMSPVNLSFRDVEDLTLSLETHLGVTTSAHAQFPTAYVTLPSTAITGRPKPYIGKHVIR